jgi:hypothetical protein
MDIASNKVSMSGIAIDPVKLNVIISLSQQSVVKMHKLLDEYISSITNPNFIKQLLNYISVNSDGIIKFTIISIFIGSVVGGATLLIAKFLRYKESDVLINETAGIAYNVADIAALQLNLTKKVSQINTHVIEVEKVSQAARDNLLQIHNSTTAEIDQIYNHRALQTNINEALYKDVARLTETSDANTLYIMTTANRLRSLITEVAAIAH